jgi:circadian clock protein KaiC
VQSTGSTVRANGFVRKTPTGIAGLDEITFGGLPTGRPTLVCGGPGSGKTLLGVSFLVNGAVDYNEPGVLMSFEENAEELAQDVASLGFDLDALVASGKLVVDHVVIDRTEIEETGEYDLEGLFVRLDYAVSRVGARRVLLDTPESLFFGFKDEGILRAELRRLFRWLKDRGLTAVITGERGETSLTRFGLEEYVSDAVILLDHRVLDQISTRRLRIVKFRGSTHGTNEYPFLIDREGVSVLPLTSLTLASEASTERVSTGLPALDSMLGGQGYFRGSSVLVSGSAGTGKTTLAAHFVDAASRRNERSLYFLFEESEAQMIRNMRSAGIDLGQWADRGLLQFCADRPTRYGLEAHLVSMHRAVEAFQPDVVVLDPITNMLLIGPHTDVRAMLTRMIDFLKTRRITALFTSLTMAGSPAETSETLISSLMDTWIMTELSEVAHERLRSIFVLKSRGMAHSNAVRGFQITDQGIDIQSSQAAAGGR